MSIILLGSPLGFLVGQSLGGWVAATWDWRTAFLALGVPGLLAATLAWLTLREPPRGLAEGTAATGAPPSLQQTVSALWSRPAFRHLLVSYFVTQQRAKLNIHARKLPLKSAYVQQVSDDYEKIRIQRRRHPLTEDRRLRRESARPA